jgi:hypothetical protein
MKNVRNGGSKMLNSNSKTQAGHKQTHRCINSNSKQAQHNAVSALTQPQSALFVYQKAQK